MPGSVKHLLEVYEVVEQIALVLKVFLCNNSAVEDLFYSAPARGHNGKTWVFRLRHLWQPQIRKLN